MGETTILEARREAARYGMAVRHLERELAAARKREAVARALVRFLEGPETAA